MSRRVLLGYRGDEPVQLLPGAALLMVGSIAAGIASASLLYLVGLAAAAWATRSARHALEALTFAWLITSISPLAVPEIGGLGAIRWLILLTAFARVFLQWFWTQRSWPEAVRRLMVYALAAALLALIAGFQPRIALLKLTAFCIGVTTVVLGYRMSDRPASYWYSWMLTLAGVVLLGSVLMTAAGLGKRHPTYGNQGILTHQQALGVYLGLVVACIGGLCIERAQPVRLYLLLAVAAAFMFMSLARSALIAILIGGVLTLMQRPHRVCLRRFVARVPLATAAVAIGLLGVLVWPPTQQRILAYVQKHGTEEMTMEQRFALSRGGLIQASLGNFKHYPLTGIGFGLPSFVTELPGELNTGKALPLSLPTEKGFLPSASLEETGIFGTALLVWFLLSLIRPAWCTRSFAAMLLCGTCIGVNSGEMVFFSFGGMGLIVWLMLGMTHVPAAQPVPEPAEPHEHAIRLLEPV